MLSPFLQCCRIPGRRPRCGFREGTEREREKGGDIADHGNGIALYNVNQRLKLLFGENYGLHIYSMEGEGTDVEIQMPVRTGRKD